MSCIRPKDQTVFVINWWIKHKEYHLQLIIHFLADLILLDYTKQKKKKKETKDCHWREMSKNNEGYKCAETMYLASVISQLNVIRFLTKRRE